MATSKDAGNNTTTYGYDGSGRLNSIITARSVKVTIGYDPSGRAASVSRWDGSTERKTQFTYGTGTQTTQIDPNGGYWRHNLASAKKRTGVQDPVSYTHLDVYKRQVQCVPGVRCDLR